MPLAKDICSSKRLSAQLVATLAANGWLERLGHGVFLLPGDQLLRDASLVPGLHVAGKTALTLRGLRHNLAVNERLTLWGDKPTTLQAWFTTAFLAHYQATHLFDAALDAHAGLAPLPAGHSDVWVSTP